MSDFIDRAKLEAAMLQVDVAHFASKKPHPTVEDYATAVLALLDAETTEEWGVEDTGGGFLVEYDEEADARDIAMNSERPGATISREVVSRRVLYGPWLPSEGGEKRG